MTLKDLQCIGSHNKIEEKAYETNSDIKRNISKRVFIWWTLIDKYVKVFYNFTSEYRKQYDEKSRTF